MRTSLHPILLRRLLFFCLLLLMLIAPVSISGQGNGDVLIYSLKAGEQTIFNVYDPVSNTSSPLIKIDSPYSASSVSPQGVLAVSWQGNGDIYLVPIDTLDHSLTKITDHWMLMRFQRRGVLMGATLLIRHRMPKMV